jgi:intraflagellar transport protein 80
VVSLLIRNSLHDALSSERQSLLYSTEYVVFTENYSDLGKAPHIFAFLDAQCTVRRADGAFLHLSIPPFPAVLHEHVTARKWDDAARLCRFVKDKGLWSCLAILSAELRQLGTAEAAYAAIDEARQDE